MDQDPEQLRGCLLEPNLQCRGKIVHARERQVRDVEISAVQREILRRGGVILYEDAALVPEGLSSP